MAFELVNDEVRIRRIGSVIERTTGLLKGDEPPPSAEELREMAEHAIAQDVIERSNT